MDKKHFDDPTKIDTVPAFLTEDTIARLNAWPHGVEFWNGAKWLPTRERVQKHFAGVYRARPAPLTQDVVPWDALADWVQWVARDKDGQAWAFEEAPEPEQSMWCEGTGKTERIGNLFKSYRRGTVHWRDSLQKRPEGV